MWISWFCSACLQSIFPFNHIADDDEFMAATSDSIDYLNLNFDPFTYDENRPLLNTEDLDPDFNYYNNIPFVDSCYKLTSELVCQENGKQCSNFSILHANCRGLEHNFDKLVSLTSSAPIDISIIATTETWTNSANEDNYKLCGYNFEVKSRQYKHCRGVGLFISDFLKYKLRDDLCIDSPDIIESIFVELDYNNIIIGCVYRPPGADVAVFTAYVDTLFSKINKEKKKMLYCR